MKILINDAQSTVNPEEGETLGHLFMRLEDYFIQQKQTVLSVTIDDIELNAEQQKTMSGEPTSTYDVIKIQMVETRLLPLNTLQEFKPLLEEAATTAEKIAINLQSGNIKESLVQVDSLLQVWAVLFQTLSDSAKLLNFKLEDIKVDDSDVEKYTIKLTENLLEMKDNLGNRDYVSVADVLEYEIAPATLKWISILDIIIEFISKRLANEPARQ